MSHRGLALVLLSSIGLVTPVTAGTISVAWNPVDHPDLAGYRVYYDSVPGAFGSSVDAGTGTAATLSGLADCTSYEVAVKSYDAGGQFSPLSSVVSGWPRPVLSAITPAQIQRNSQVQLVLDGTNFQSGAAVTFSNAGIAIVGAPTRDSCSRLRVTVAISAQAALGAVTVRAINSDQVFGEAAGLLAVTADATAPQISQVAAGNVSATTAGVSWSTDEPASSQVFFRRQGETSYQATAADATLTTSHSVALVGLWPDTIYEFHVKSADAAGNSTTSTPDELFETGPSGFSYIRIEAEAGTLTSPLVKKSGSDVFSGQWVELPSGQSGGASNPAGTATLGFYLPSAGNWRVWVRVRGTDAGGAGWFEGVDGASLQAIVHTTPGVWQWLPGRTYSLAAGLHTLRLGGRKGEARADRAIVTDDPTFTPTEQPGSDVTPPGAVTGLAVTPADGMLQLGWNNPQEAGPLTVVVRYRDDGSFPLNPADGKPVVALPVTPGGASSFDHTGLTNGTTYRYAAFALDFAGNVSTAATAAGTPANAPPPTVENLHRTDVVP